MVDFPAPESPVNQSTHGPLHLQRRADVLGDRQRLLPHIETAAQSKIHGAGGDRGVGEAVDQDEAAGLANLRKAVERNGRRGGDVANADFVERQRVRGLPPQRLDIDAMLDTGHARGDGADADLEQVFTSGQQRLLAHPDQVGFELIGDLRRPVGRDQRVAARHIDVAVEADGDRLARGRMRPLFARHHDAVHLGADAGRRHLHRIAGSDGSTGDDAGIKPAVAIGPQHGLHQNAQRGLERSAAISTVSR